MEGGGALWLLIALGIVILGIGMIYGTAMWRQARKDPQARARSDAATRENYRRGG